MRPYKNEILKLQTFFIIVTILGRGGITCVAKKSTQDIKGYANDLGNVNTIAVKLVKCQLKLYVHIFI